MKIWGYVIKKINNNSVCKKETNLIDRNNTIHYKVFKACKNMENESLFVLYKGY